LAWRDPFFFHDTASGSNLLFLAADLPWNSKARGFEMCWAKAGTDKEERECHESQFQGGIGLARLPADPLDGGWDLMAPATAPLVLTNFTLIKKWGQYHVTGTQSGFWEMERPQVLYNQGRYHLFFHCWGFHINPDWAGKHLPRGLEYGNQHSLLYHFEASIAEGPYMPSKSTPVVPGSAETGLYGVHFVPAPRSMSLTGSPEWIVFGWNRGEVSLEISGTYHFRFDADGSPLLFRPLDSRL